MRLLPLIFLLAALIASAAEPLSSKIDSVFSPFVGRDKPGLAVLVRKDGRTVFQRGYGVRELGKPARIDAHTNFRLASVSKQFTAMAVMLLVQDGKLRYDQTLNSFFPEFPAYGRAISVGHLLTHTSGLPDYEDLMDAAGKSWSPTRQIQDREVLQLLERQSAGKFAPGTKWSYSNSGYVLLGLIVAQVSGEPFDAFLQRRIFAPLRMSSTVAYVNGKNKVKNRAYGNPNDQSSTSATLGDGGVYSNLVDLAKWDAALQERDLSAALKPVTLSGGRQPHWPSEPGEDNLAPGKPVYYGFGWFLDPYRDHSRMWHFGSTSGFRSAIERFTRDRITIVILCNRTDLDPAKLALQVADIVYESSLRK